MLNVDGCSLMVASLRFRIEDCRCGLKVKVVGCRLTALKLKFACLSSKVECQMLKGIYQTLQFECLY